MDLTKFIQQSKTSTDLPYFSTGLYCVEQKHIPAKFQSFRCGLAGLPRDSSAEEANSSSNFVNRFSKYLSGGWLPTDGVVHAILLVPRTRIAGFAERVMPVVQEGDRREPHQRLDKATTLIELREREYHDNLLSGGDKMRRIGMPGVDQSRMRGEFFRGDLSKVIRSLKAIGTGDLYLFESNSKVRKIELRRRGVQEVVTEQVELRRSPRFVVSDTVARALAEGDKATTEAIGRLKNIQVVRRSPRLAAG